MKSILISLSIFFFTSAVFSQSGWVQQYSGINLKLRSVYFVNENTGWAAGDSGKILHTTNGGINWILQVTNTTRAFSKIIFSDANSGIATGSYNDGNPWCQDIVIVLSTTNGGLNWTVIQNGYGSRITDLNRISNNIYYATSGTDFMCFQSVGLVGKTTNNGMNWQYFSTPNGGFAYSSISFINTLSGWATGEFSSDVLPPLKQIIRTTDGGKNWEILRSDTIRFGIFPNIGLRFYDSNTGYMFNNSLRKTTDGGYSWNQTDSIATSGKSDYCFINSDTGWCVGSGGSIIRTNNGGSNWNVQNSNVTNYLYSIYFVNNNIGYIAGSNGIILKTITGGLTSVNQLSSNIPSSYFLGQNYPNPFNPATKINYELPASRGERVPNYVSVTIFNSLGEKVESLVNQKQNAGRYEIKFLGNDLPSGLYFYSLSINGLTVDTKRMILLK